MEKARYISPRIQSRNLTQAATFLTCIREMVVRISAETTILSFMVFLSLCRQMVAQNLKLEPDSFVPYPFQFIRRVIDSGDT
jgi:hypothetical protein